MVSNALTDAFVLHTRRYGDTSLLIELFGPSLGRAVCVAKGVLSGRRQSARLQPFQPLLVSLRGRGEVQTLNQAEPDGCALALTGRALYCGLYLNELILKTTARGDALPGLFGDYEATLRQLVGNVEVEPKLRCFEIALLRELGHGLVLDADSGGHPVDADARYLYRVGSGPVRVDAAAEQGYSGAVLHALSHGEFESVEILREARVFMREVLDHHLDGRPIRSRDLFR